MAHDPNAVNNALGSIWNKSVEASNAYSQLGDRDRFKVVGAATFAMINPDGSLEAPELLGKAGARATETLNAGLQDLGRTTEADQIALRNTPNGIEQQDTQVEFIRGQRGPEEPMDESLRRPIRERVEEATRVLTPYEQDFLKKYKVQVIPVDNLSLKGAEDVGGFFMQTKFDRTMLLPGKFTDGTVNRDLLYAYRHEFGHALDMNGLRTPEQVFAEATSDAPLVRNRISDTEKFTKAFDKDMEKLDLVDRENLGRYGTGDADARHELFASLWAHAFETDTSDILEANLGRKFQHSLEYMKELAAKLGNEV